MKPSCSGVLHVLLQCAFGVRMLFSLKSAHSRAFDLGQILASACCMCRNYGDSENAIVSRE